MATLHPDVAASTNFGTHRSGDSSMPLKRSELVSEIAVMLQKMHKQSELTLDALRNLYSVSNIPPGEHCDQGSVQYEETARSSPTEPSNPKSKAARPFVEPFECHPEQTPENVPPTILAATGASVPAGDGATSSNSEATSVLHGLHADIDRMLRTAEALRSYNTDTKGLYKELQTISMMPELTPEDASSTRNRGAAIEDRLPADEQLNRVPDLGSAAHPTDSRPPQDAQLLQASNAPQQRPSLSFGAPPPSASAMMSNVAPPRYAGRPSASLLPQEALPMTTSTSSSCLPHSTSSTKSQYSMSPSAPSRVNSVSSSRTRSLGGRAGASSPTFPGAHDLGASSKAIGSRASPVRQLSPAPASRHLSPCMLQRTTGVGSQRIPRATTPRKYSSPTRSVARGSPGPSRATSPGPAQRLANQPVLSPDSATTLQGVSLAGMFEVGAHTIAGAKTQCKDWINQDAYLVSSISHDRLVVVVFDGHGVNGHHCANFAKKMFAEQASVLASAGPNLENAFRALFRNVQSGLESQGLASMAGTTATVAVVDATAGTVSTAYVGDSRLLAALGPRVYFETKDHTFDPAAESRCIEHGGEVREQTYAGVCARRVFKRGEAWPGLAMSRSLGDLECHQLGVLAEPTVHCCAPFWPGCTLVLASDGVWEKISSEQAAREVADLESQAAAKALVDKAHSRWQGDVDDITVIVVRLTKPSGGVSSASSGVPVQQSSSGSMVAAPLSSASSSRVSRSSPGRTNIRRYSSTTCSPTCSTLAPFTSSSSLGLMRNSSPTRVGFMSPSQSSRQSEVVPTWLTAGSPRQSSCHMHRMSKTPLRA